MRVAVIGNGQSVHVVGRSAALAARGPRVRLVTLGPVLPVTGIEVRTRPIPRSPLAGARALAGFLRDVRSFEPDLLHLHYAGGRLGSLALLTGIRPLVVNVVGGDVLPDQHPGGLSRMAKRATRRILERADALLVKSEGLLPALSELADVGGKAHVVRWGIDPRQFFPDPAGAAAWRRRLQLPDEALVVLSPRLLRPLYNIHLIVEAFAEVARLSPAAVLLIAEYGADAGYRRDIERRVAGLDLVPRVHFVGAVPQTEMRGLYSAAAAVVMAPVSDGLPQSLFEALACGAPVLLGRLPGYAEIVDEGRSALFAEIDAPSIAEGLGRLLRDDRLRAALGEEGRAVATRKASLPDDVERVLRIFESVCAQPRKKAPRDPGGALLDAVGLAWP
ncbi:MAG TPA: glycosyltransferase family 4 protein [Vicinamibacteria bacterium]|nr:glycosyltransferase family 4 protein [Vicinamibacteria bacterium]HRB11667.1 glycosyltransferase family 4 protein [Vicinamibacteria bacterium]